MALFVCRTGSAQRFHDEMDEEEGNGGKGWVIEKKENLKYIEGIETPPSKSLRPSSSSTV